MYVLVGNKAYIAIHLAPPGALIACLENRDAIYTIIKAVKFIMDTI